MKGFTPVEIAGVVGFETIEGLISGLPLVSGDNLLKQLSLHLPRLRNLDRASIMAESARLAHRLQHLRSLAPRPSQTPRRSLQALTFQVIPESTARLVLNNYHYLLSFRPESVHLGLLGAGDSWPIAMATVSTCDLGNITVAWGEVEPTSLAVLSRVFAFEQAPRNSISYMLARVRRWLRDRQPTIEYLITYVNPNVGFDGSSYTADNWSRLGWETGTRYMYVDRNYCTERVAALRKPDEHEVAYSSHTLLPLQLMYRRLGRGDQPPRSLHFERWTPRGRETSVMSR